MAKTTCHPKATYPGPTLKHRSLPLPVRFLQLKMSGFGLKVRVGSWLAKASRVKLADILLSVTLLFKLLAEASTAIHSVVFLLWDHADKVLSSTIVDQISDKLINKISTPIIEFNKAFIAFKSFLDATAQKQAAELLALQESTKQQSGLYKSLANSTKKIGSTSNPRCLLDAVWPHLLAFSSFPTGLSQNGLLLTPTWGNVHVNPKVAQWVTLTSKQLSINRVQAAGRRQWALN